MKPSSLELVEKVMSIEEAFEIEIPDDNALRFGSPREIVDSVAPHLSNQRPNKEAAAFLRKLARAQQRPELAEGLNGTWRREQIAAIISEIFR